MHPHPGAAAADRRGRARAADLPQPDPADGPARGLPGPHRGRQGAPARAHRAARAAGGPRPPPPQRVLPAPRRGPRAPPALVDKIVLDVARGVARAPRQLSLLDGADARAEESLEGLLAEMAAELGAE